MDAGRLALRVVVGGLLIGHGTQKLFGWFGGGGQAGTRQMMEHIQMHPVKVNAVASGLAEAGSGALLVAGLAVPVAAAGVTSAMTTAIAKVHHANGVWSSKGGWEYNAVLIAATAALAEVGPGRESLDRLTGMHWHGPRWALAAVAAGAAASGLAIRAARFFRPTPPEAAHPADPASPAATSPADPPSPATPSPADPPQPASPADAASSAAATPGERQKAAAEPKDDEAGGVPGR